MSADHRELAFLLGLPFHVITMDETIRDAIAHIENGEPGYYVTANADFVAQAYNNESLKDILFHADRVVCDGMPLVWLSRYFKPALPERVAGSDMVFRLFAEARERNWKVYFLGSDEATLLRSKTILEEQYRGIQIVGTFAPPFGAVGSWPNEEILEEIHSTKPDLLLVAVGCPKQEYWISSFYRSAGVPLSVGIGASLDFICGTQTRAPMWIQKIGMEWMWRMLTNPKRLLKRYAKDLYFLFLLGSRQFRLTRSPGSKLKSIDSVDDREAGGEHSVSSEGLCHWLSWGGSVDYASLDELEMPVDYSKPIFLDASMVTFIDSSGVGRLAQIAREAKQGSVLFGLIQPSGAVENIIHAMHLQAQFPIFQEKAEALQLVEADRSKK